MTNGEWLIGATKELTSAGISTARLDALILMEEVLDTDRAQLLAHPELELTHEQYSELESQLKRRRQHEPLAYIRGKTEFYGRTFTVNEHVLVPRPESEDMIELLAEYGEVPTIIDVGTGSGALAISAKLARPHADVLAVDIDTNCLEVARQNAKTHNVSINFIESDLLRAVDVEAYRTPAFILANLPYVPNTFDINQAAKHEPALALFGGNDGLDLYRVMFDQLREYDESEIVLFTESLESQHENLAGIARDHGFTHTKTTGLIQNFIYIP